MQKLLVITMSMLGWILPLHAQVSKPEDTEVWSPEPPVISTSHTAGNAPSDAIILFDGNNLNEWVLSNDSASVRKWSVSGKIFTVDKRVGDLQTKRKFTDFQLHIEYRIPADITGTGQGRGNSGIFLAALPGGAGGYELQVLDNYRNKTYVNGQAGSIYKQSPPLVNVCKRPGEWNVYDVIWTAPRFNEDGTLKSPARVTVLQNGVLVQNNTVLKGDTPYIGQPEYRKHGPAPIKLQAHGDDSKPISYRNIWIRNL